MNKPDVTATIGLQWGDEAKGKIVDGIAAEHDVIVRFNGGPNAGHSVKHGNTDVALHALPSGVLHPNAKMYIASGCVVDLVKLRAEIEEVEQKTSIDVRSRLGISPHAPVIQPHHVLRDKVTMYKIGTTGSGIGPAYADVNNRMDGTRKLSITIGEMMDDPEECAGRMTDNLIAEWEHVFGRKDIDQETIKQLYKQFDPAKCIDAHMRAYEYLKKCFDVDPYRLMKWYRAGMSILLEGAQAEGLDPVRGAAPYTTSSRVGVNAALDSANLPPGSVTNVIGVGKLETSRVGNGPFISEFGGAASEEWCMRDGGKAHTKDVEKKMFGDRLAEMMRSGDPMQIGQAMRVMTGEYGVTSKRPRRIGAFDTVQLRAAAELHGVNQLVLSKLDCMKLFHMTKDGTIPVVTNYEMDGNPISHMPATEAQARRTSPIYEYFPAFSEDISHVREAKDLPGDAMNFIRELERRLDMPISMVGVGPDREQIVGLHS